MRRNENSGTDTSDSVAIMLIMMKNLVTITILLTSLLMLTQSARIAAPGSARIDIVDIGAGGVAGGGSSNSTSGSVRI